MENYVYRFKLPNPEKKLDVLQQQLEEQLKRLEATLSAADTATQEQLKSLTKSLEDAIFDVKGLIESQQDSQLLANGVFDEAINSIEQKISEIDATYANREDLAKNIIDTSKLLEATSSLSAQLIRLIGDVKSLSSRMSVALDMKADKSDIVDVKKQIAALPVPKEVTVVADSDNVTVTQRGSEFGVAVTNPAAIVRSGGGVSKATVVKLIQEYSPTGEVSKTFGYDVNDNLVLLTSSQGTQTFSYGSGGELLNIVGTGSYVSKSFSYDLEGKLTGITIL